MPHNINHTSPARDAKRRGAGLPRTVMLSTSEWVSLGHPDKVADYISSYLLDRHLEIDPDTRFAVEVQIKSEYVTLGGEITTKAEFADHEIAELD